MPGFAVVADNSVVEANDGNLAIVRYVKPLKAAKTDGESKSLSASWDEFDASGQKFWADLEAVVDMLDGSEMTGKHDG